MSAGSNSNRSNWQSATTCGGGNNLGAVQKGPALLGGLLRCRACGRKLMVRYWGERGDIVRYGCKRGWLDNGEPRCIAFGGTTVDEAIGQQLLRVVEPAAVEAAIMATEEEIQRRRSSGGIEKRSGSGSL